MKGPVIGIVIVLALLATGAIFFAGNAFVPEAQTPLEQTYGNDLFGVSFAYPVGYLLAEAEVGVLGRTHHVITIIKEEDAVPRIHSEGPPTITLDFYQNDTKPQTLEEWVKGDESNLRLGNGESTSLTVDGVEGVQFNWSGLYEGETTAFLHNGKVVAVSVTYLSPADEIYLDYQALLRSLRLR